MKYSDVKDLTVEELRKRVATTREEMFEAKMKHSLGQLGSPLEIRNKRKDVARLKTALNEKLSRG